MIADLSSVVEGSNPGIPGLRGDFFISTLQTKLCIHSLAVLSKENAFKNISGLWSPRQSRYVVHCSSTVLPYHVGFSETFVTHTYVQCTLVIVCLNPKWRPQATVKQESRILSTWNLHSFVSSLGNFGNRRSNSLF